MQSQSRAERVKELVLSSLGQSPPERDEFIRSACEQDQLLEHEVRSLVSFHVEEDVRLESTVLDVSVGGLARRALSENHHFISGDLGRYRILREIGRGGMGVVYEGNRIDGEYEQRVAIKLIAPGFESDFTAQRFRKERQILAGLNHPNIAQLLDGGTTGDGLPYLVMEYVEGLAVDKYAAEKSLTMRQRLTLFRKICDAVAYAHQKGVIHRDIKPGNILVTEAGVPKLLDFGIAKVLTPSDSSTALQTTAMLVMTPEYSSPEQVRGERITYSTDIYSLGVVLYQLLTGRLPYRFKSKQAEEVAGLIKAQQPEKPSLAVASIGPSAETDKSEQLPQSDRAHRESDARKLRGDLDNIVLTAIRKEPERRYASVEQFSEDIGLHLRGLPITARKDSLGYRASKFIQRYGAYTATTLLIAALFAILGLFAGSLSNHDAPRASSIAVLPFAEANSRNDEPDYVSDGITEYLIERLSRFSDLKVSPRDSVFRYKGQPQDLASIERTLGVENVLTGTIRRDGDKLSIDVKLIEAGTHETIWNHSYNGQSSDILALQQELARDLAYKLRLPVEVMDQRPERRHTNNSEAYYLYLKGRYFWNRRDGESVWKGVDYFHQSIAKDPNYALAYSGLADCHTLLAIYGDVKSLDAAKVAASKALEIDPQLAEPHISLAALKWLFEWDWRGADREFKTGISLNPRSITGHHWYGLYLAEMGRSDEALAAEKRALDLDPLSLVINADLGRVLYYARRYDESLEQYQKTLEMDPAFDTALTDILFVYEQKGMFEEMLAVIDRLGRDKRRELREAYSKRGRRGFWLKQLEIAKAKNPRSYELQAEIHLRLGENQRALELLGQAYDNRQFGLQQIRVNPVFDPLRTNPRFVELLERMNLGGG